MAVMTRIETPAQHEVALARLDQLMDAEAGTPEAVELSGLAEAIDEYGSRNFLQVPTDGVDALEFFLDQGTATLDEILTAFGSESAFVGFMFRARPMDHETARALGALLSRPPEHFTDPFVEGVPADDILIGGTPWRERLAAMRDALRNTRAA